MFELSHWQYDSISRWRMARPWSASTKLVKVRVCNEERSYPTERLLDMGAQVVIVRMNLVFCNEMPLAVHGEITQSSALMCGVLSVGWQAQASCDRMLGSQQQGIKCRRLYYNLRSTIQLTLMFTSSPPSEACNGSSTYIWINRLTVTST